MECNLSGIDICLSLSAIVLAVIITLFFKKILYKIKRPNGKKGGVISLHVTLAFSIVAVIALSTKDWFLTLLTVILAYLIAKGRMDESQHYLYQVVLGGIVGLAVPYGVFYLYYKQINPFSFGRVEREEFANMPAKAIDDRVEADKYGSDLRLED